MQTIRTRYLPPTNTLGARLKALCEAGSVTVSYGYGETRDEHARAALTLLAKLGWGGDWAMGPLPHPDPGYCAVCVRPSSICPAAITSNN